MSIHEFHYVKRTSARAKKMAGASFVPKGKKPPLGQGGRFQALKQALAKKGARTPRALAAWIGRKKLGKARFQKLAIKGRKKKASKIERLRKKLGYAD